MDKKVIIAGAGHGGLAAAYYLAKNGIDVTVYEKEKRKNLGHAQSDFIHLDGFEKSGIPLPEEYVTPRIPITFSVLGEDIEPVSQNGGEHLKNVCIDRHVLYEYLIKLAEEAGVKFVFGCRIDEPIIIGSRVVGIKTSKGEFLANLVIDACGVNSPIRTNLPDFMNIQQQPGRYDVIKTYRAYFNKNENCEEPPYRYCVSMILGDFTGISWIITEPDCIDMLISSFTTLDEDDVDHYLKIYRDTYPHLGSKLLKGGKFVNIPVRQPLAVLVADGYAAVGDSAFMTVPIKGSGIGYSLRAGKLLADCVLLDEDLQCSRETLWKYQRDFFHEIGFGSCILATLKNKLPTLSPDVVRYAFNEKIITSEDLTLFGNEAGFAKILRSLSLTKINEKARKVIANGDIRKVLSEFARWMTRYKIVEASFPDKYDSAGIAKWSNSYDEFFEDIKPNNDDD